jgi:hypothetical protein
MQQFAILRLIALMNLETISLRERVAEACSVLWMSALASFRHLRNARFESLRRSWRQDGWLIHRDGVHARELPCETEHGDVIFLAEGLCRAGDLLRGLAAEGLRAVKAEELAREITCFNHTVRQERKAFTRAEREDLFGILGIRSKPQRQPALDLQLYSIKVGSDVSGIGYRQRSVTRHMHHQAGGEAVLAAAEHVQVHGVEDFTRALREVGEGADGAD